MMRILSGMLLLILILISTVIAVAAVNQAASPAPSWFEHVDLMSLVIWALILVVVWFFLRTLKKIDTNQARLFEKLDTLCEDFYTLRGEHNAIKARCDKAS
jgi:biopolymer transport protein ExbB/TolQ